MLSDMDLSHFDTMDAAELRSYLAFLLWHYRVVDGFWFLYMTEGYDLPAAERLNERVWARVSGLATRDLVSRFAITEKGLEGFARVLRLYPWTALLEYQIDESPDEIVLTVPCCATQEARRRRGMQEYLCQEMHRREFLGMAAEVDSRIRVHCDFAPPGERPAGFDCRWRFTVDPSAVEAEQLSGADEAS
jgi:DNA-binding PadR family transcriptional regulator